jgi:hypothetical protein
MKFKRYFEYRRFFLFAFFKSNKKFGSLLSFGTVRSGLSNLGSNLEAGKVFTKEIWVGFIQKSFEIKKLFL